MSDEAMTGIDLKRARKRLGLKQAELAERLGRTPTQISRLENTEGPIPQIYVLAMRQIETDVAA